MFSRSKQRKVVAAIIRWYTRHGRGLPWRLSDKPKRVNPYRLLISEIMLQQTQVNRVLIKYPGFLRRFPTLRALADASRRDVVMEWQGMGYNNRAVRLHTLARTVVQEHKGRLPDDYEALVRLPGIGRYTANALRSALGADVAAVDVNVQRVLSRIFWRMRTVQELRSLREAWERAESVLPHGRAYRWNQSLMDLGATICTARNPLCKECPVATFCASRQTMSRIVVRQPKREPSLDGIPNRVYRGRIVEELRQIGRTRSLAVVQVGKRIHPSFSQQHARWLDALLFGLKKDGLIRIRGNGSLKTRYVSLA